MTSVRQETCRRCDLVFETADRRKIYCTRKCKTRAVQAAWLERNPKPKAQGELRVCLKCAQKFVAKRKDKVYCTEECGKRASAVAWAVKYRERHNAHRMKYAKAHRPESLLRGAAYRKKNYEELKEKAVVYYAVHRGEIAKKCAAKYAACPKAFYIKQKKWRDSHPDSERARKQRRRAREYGAAGGFAAGDLDRLRVVFGTACLRCRSVASLTVDHVVPLALGGSNNPDNLQPLCRSCNSKKGARSCADYRTAAQMESLRTS